MERLKLEGDLVLVTEGPSRKHPGRNNRMEIIDLRDLTARCTPDASIASMD
jgi:hypothetical protein